MKATLELKDDKKVTVYTVDLSKMGVTAKVAAEKVEAFFKETFKDTLKKETYVKED